MRKYEQAKGVSRILMSDMDTVANLSRTWRGRKVLRAIKHNWKRNRTSSLPASMPRVSYQTRYVDFIDADGKRIRGRFYISRDKRYIRAKRS